MAPIITRLLLTLSLFVAAPLSYILIIVMMFQAVGYYQNDEFVFAIANLVVGCMFAGIWLLIWFREVRWTAWRMGLTVGVAIGSILLTLIMVGVMLLVMRGDEELASLLAGMIWLVLWLFGTSLAWMELPHERRKRYAAMGLEKVPCPSCGYNLSGLKETKCPECGASYTVDSLLAAIQEQARPL